MPTDLISLYREQIGCSIQELAAGLEHLAKQIDPHATCIYRTKEPQTLEKKLALKGAVGITSIDDIYGLRILVSACRHLYPVLNLVATANPGYLDYDYVASPKINPQRPGKQLRLIQYIVRRNGLTFEVQVTTRKWNTLNEALHAGYHKRKYGD